MRSHCQLCKLEHLEGSFGFVSMQLNRYIQMIMLALLVLHVDMSCQVAIGQPAEALQLDVVLYLLP